jgi:hypothetical protein
VEAPAAVEFVGNALAEGFVVGSGNTAVQLHVLAL